MASGALAGAIAWCREEDRGTSALELPLVVRSSHAAARLQRYCFAPVAFTRRLSNEVTAFAQD